MQITPVATTPADFVPGIITDEEAAAGLRAVLNVFRHWNLSDSQSADLVDTTPRTFARWKTGKSGKMGRDQKERVATILGIHKALRILFVDQQRAYAWVKAPNSAFGGTAALDIMLEGGLLGLTRIRRYLDAVRGG